MKNDASKQKEQSERVHEAAKTVLQESTAGLKKTLQEKVAAHREKEQEFRKVRTERRVESAVFHPELKPKWGRIAHQRASFDNPHPPLGIIFGSELGEGK